MPVYLLHGFRWPRSLIRIHIIVQNLDDAAAEWLMAPPTTRCLRENLAEQYPHVVEALPSLRFIEQYDPNDLTNKSQPYAYVADTVHEVELGVDVDDIRGRGLPAETWSAISELRDKLCPDVKLAWYVVVCGDEERLVPPDGSEAGTVPESAVSSGSGVWSSQNGGTSYTTSTTVNGSKGGRESSEEKRSGRSNSISRSLKRVFGRKELKKSQSLKDLKNPTAMDSTYSTISSNDRRVPPMPPPPLPGTAR